VKYISIPSYGKFKAALADFEAEYGRHGTAFDLLAEPLKGKVARQMARTNDLIREEADAASVAAACDAMIKGLNAAAQQLKDRASPKPSQAYMTGMLGGHKVRVYENRGAIPDDDGAGGIACVALTDLLEFFPQDVLPMLTAFPGASVTKLLDGRPAVREGEKKAGGAWADMKDDIPW